MALAQLADKTTLDKIDTDVTTLKSRGGIKVANDDIYGYDIANDEWVKVNIRNMTGANPTLIVINKDMTMTGKPVTVSNGTYYSRTQVMPNAKFDVFALPRLGNYVVSWTSAGKAKSKVVEVNALGGVVVQVVNYPSFANATWTEISNLLNEAYTNDFDLTDIWDVGNTKSVDFSEASGYNYMPTQPAGTREIVILDFDYDTLTTAIGENTKAKITLGLHQKLPNGGFPMDNREGDWTSNPPMRYFCNNGFYNSMPSGLKSLIKPVQKSGVSDYCSFISVTEYNGANKYMYLQDSDNIGFLNSSWTRDSTYRYGRYWYYITSNYNIAETSGTFNLSSAPIFSI